MHRICLILLLGCAPLLVEAQIFGPVAVPVKEKKDQAGDGNWLAVEVSAGGNLVTRRKLLYDFPTVDGLRPGLGARAGLKATVFPDSDVRLLLGVNFLNDRGTLTNYRKESNGGLFFVADPNEVNRIRTGDVTINEKWWRLSLGLGFPLGRFSGEVSFMASSILNGSQLYNYQQTITAFVDPITGQTIPLNSPIVRSGNRNFYRDNFGGYGGITFAISYPLTERLNVELEYEQGWHLDANGGSFEEWRQRRSRMGLTLGYRLFGLKRRR